MTVAVLALIAPSASRAMALAVSFVILLFLLQALQDLFECSLSSVVAVESAVFVSLLDAYFDIFP
jgi:hypothetical protein